MQWNERRQNEALARADVVLVIDSDVPWIGAVSKPRAGARVFHIDADALKQQMPLWYIGSELACQADAATALAQLRAAARDSPHAERLPRRMRHLEAAHEAWEGFIAAHERPLEKLTPQYLMASIRDAVGPDAIVVSEAVTNFHVVSQHMQRTMPGTLFSSGGGSLGYNGGAAFGIKLAKPDALVVAICGDGSYLFSQPSAVHWMARRYRAPFLHVVLNNGGWRRRARRWRACIRMGSRRHRTEHRHRFSAATGLRGHRRGGRWCARGNRPQCRRSQTRAGTRAARHPRKEACSGDRRSRRLIRGIQFESTPQPAASGPDGEYQGQIAQCDEQGGSQQFRDHADILNSFSAFVWKYFFLSAADMGSSSETVTSDGRYWYG